MIEHDTTVEDTDQERRARALVGQVLREKYRLERLLGTGGAGAVFAATNVRTRMPVAVKVLLPYFDPRTTEADRRQTLAELKKRFFREGYASNSVEHPGAVRVLDLDEAEGGLLFLVMELLVGETLHTFWKRLGWRVSPLETLAVTAEVLDVLAAAHERGILHRDIKPANIFLTRSERGGALVVKVLDFGMARIHDPERAGADITREGIRMGTPGFASPEQAWGVGADHRSDIFSVGATMFALLSGHIYKSQPVRSALLELPGPIAAIIERALHADPQKRWASAGEMRQAVRQAIQWIELSVAPTFPGGARAPLPIRQDQHGQHAAVAPPAQPPAQVPQYNRNSLNGLVTVVLWFVVFAVAGFFVVATLHHFKVF